MRKHTVIYDFSKLSIPELITFSYHIYNSMNGNSRFPNPDISLELINVQTGNLSTHHIAAQGGSHEETALMRKTRDELVEILKKLANYVDRIADGDEATIMNSGFHLAKQPVPPQHAEFSVEAGEKPGTVDLKRQAVDGAKSYIWQTSQDVIPPDDRGWIFAGASTTVKFTVTGLNSVTRYYFRSAAVTSEGLTAYTEPVAKVVE